MQCKNGHAIRPRNTGYTVSVGVTGHRSLPQANLPLLRAQFETVLRFIQCETEKRWEGRGSLHTEGAPCFRLLSMLAEGSDRIAALCALECGYGLHCVLPMERSAYERDFETDASKAEFQCLLNRADSTLEIACGSPTAMAYRDGGILMLNHSDLLIAIYDGVDTGKAGGTSDVIGLALRQGIPVVWIHASNPHAIRMLRAEGVEAEWQREVASALQSLLSSAGQHTC